MSFLTPQAELDYKDAQRQREVSYYVGNPAKNMRGHLYDFCVDVLGYDALSPTFHKPMLDDWDRLDLKRFRLYLGLDAHNNDPIDGLNLWFRGGIKTWCQRGRVIRYFLWDPKGTVTWWHAVEDESVASGDAIAAQLLQNKKLRALFPSGVLPAMNRKKFFTGGSFRLSGQRIGDAPSLNCLGAGGEGTGKHSVVGVLDDFVGYNDVVDGQMQKKKQFYRATVRNVVLRTQDKRGWVDAIGTHWAIDDPYADWRESPDWVTTVRACLETDGKPDENGQPVYLTREQIEKEKREQGSVMFAFQMMNDPSPSGEKPWSAECERTCTIADAKGPGYVIVLSDPAPFAMGSTDGRDERFRRDGTKNFWASVVLKLRTKGERREIIWLDAIESKMWGLEEGMTNTVKLGMKWHAKEGYTESTSTPVYLDKFIEAKRDLGWKGYIIGSRKADDRLKSTYNARAKCMYIGALADRAKQSEFLICESVPAPMREKFLSQMRGFMPLPDGRTGIPFDDLCNAVSFGTDPYFRTKYPVVDETFTIDMDDMEAYDDMYASRSRYCGA